MPPPSAVNSAAFAEGRRMCLHSLFNDPTVPVIRVMTEMSRLTEEYVLTALSPQPDLVAWVGGSLGRREMLPNSDLDLFLVWLSATQSRSAPRFKGLDRVETAEVTIAGLEALASATLIDLNQFVDGRPLWAGAARNAVVSLLAATNTYDRQHANLIVEHFYYRHFDFPDKRTPHGPNVKYSSGSARTTLFFNFFNRIVTGELPADRGDQPEFALGVHNAETLLGIPPITPAINLVQVVKNAAITTFNATHDIRQRHLSRTSLQVMFDLAQRRLRGLGLTDRNRFPDDYLRARHAVECAVLDVVGRTLGQHRSAGALRELQATPTALLPATFAAYADQFSPDAETILAFGAWLLVTRPDASADHIANSARVLLARPSREARGALLALACSPATSVEVFGRLLGWARDQGAGAYMFKLIGRNGAAPLPLRREAMAMYLAAEIVRVQ